MRQPLFEAHDRKVAEIATAVRARVGAGEPVHIYKGGVHHFVPLPGDARFGGKPIDISTLREIVHIDAERRVCVAEPGVTFAALVRATLAHGLVPVVVPELEGITVGGAVAGCSVESMSYVEGGFHDSCLEYEIVSGAGDVITCTPDKDGDLFGMIHGSYGTLGILTRLTFKLVPAQPFVHLEYRKLDSIETFDAEMRARIAARDYDFIDAILHAPDELVLCLGRFVETAPQVSNYRWLDIFYKSTRTRSEDYLSTADYFFRYDTECHWLTRTIPPLEWKPVRFVVGKFILGSTNLIKWSGRIAPLLGLKKRPDVVVDVFIPARNFVSFFKWYEKEFAYWPLWIVPYRVPTPYPWISRARKSEPGELFIDCAVYGKLNNHPTIDWSQVLEEKTYELEGFKTLISRNHHTREQFWKIYDQGNYQAAKARLDPQAVFPSLYEKFHRA